MYRESHNTAKYTAGQGHDQSKHERVYTLHSSKCFYLYRTSIRIMNILGRSSAFEDSAHKNCVKYTAALKVGITQSYRSRRVNDHQRSNDLTNFLLTRKLNSSLNLAVRSVPTSSKASSRSLESNVVVGDASTCCSFSSELFKRVSDRLFSKRETESISMAYGSAGDVGVEFDGEEIDWRPNIKSNLFAAVEISGTRPRSSAYRVAHMLLVYYFRIVVLRSLTRSGPCCEKRVSLKISPDTDNGAPLNIYSSNIGRRTHRTALQ